MKYESTPVPRSPRVTHVTTTTPIPSLVSSRKPSKGNDTNFFGFFLALSISGSLNVGGSALRYPPTDNG